MNHLMIAAVAAVFLLSPGFADAAGGWRYTNPVTSNTEAAEPESMSSATTGTTTGQSAGEVQPKFAGSTPVNNTPMTNVREQFGQPGTEVPAVGQPPITRWYYAQYTVYFEFDRVITSVIN
jgi:hypothetical protein